MRQNIRENRRVAFESMYPITRDRDRKRLTQQFGQIIEKMIAHDSEKRIQSLVDVESQLLRYLEGATTPIATAPSPISCRGDHSMSNGSASGGLLIGCLGDDAEL